MSRASKEAKSQAAADAVGEIADAVKELSDLLDGFFENYPELDGTFVDAFPDHSGVNHDVVKRLNFLSDNLAPPSGDDR